MLHLAPLANWTAVVDGTSAPLFPPTLELAGIAVRAAPAAWAAAAPGPAGTARAAAAPGPLGRLASEVTARADDGAYVLPM